MKITGAEKSVLSYFFPEKTSPPNFSLIMKTMDQSGDDRDMWTHAHSNLMKDPHNARNLSRIQTSVCVVCLDQPVTGTGDVTTIPCWYKNEVGTIGINQVWFDDNTLFYKQNLYKHQEPGQKFITP